MEALRFMVMDWQSLITMDTDGKALLAMTCVSLTAIVAFLMFNPELDRDNHGSFLPLLALIMILSLIKFPTFVGVIIIVLGAFAFVFSAVVIPTVNAVQYHISVYKHRSNNASISKADPR